MLLPIPLKPAASSNLFIYRLEEVAGFRGSGSWIPEAAACTLLIRYIRENFKITTFSRLSGIVTKICQIFRQCSMSERKNRLAITRQVKISHSGQDKIHHNLVKKHLNNMSE